MPTSDLKIAAAYIRVSTDDQEEYSPDSQVRLIREYARKNGHERFRRWSLHRPYRKLL